MADIRGPASELLAFQPQFLCDPPPWYRVELDRDTLRDLAINAVQMHKDILEAQIRASERSLEIMAKLK